MYQFNKHFSLVAVILCLGVVSSVNAAPSVRVLGASNNSSAGKTAGSSANKATGTKKGNNIKSSVLNANTGVKKSASVKTMSPTVTSMQPVARTSSGRAGTAGVGAITTATGANRFPGIASKTNVQKIYTPTTTGAITSSDPSAKGYNIQEMTERIEVLEEENGAKATKAELDNYYTKDEIDAGYYTASQVDEKIGNINTDASSPYIQGMVEDIARNRADIQTLRADSLLVYDLNSQQKKSVYIVDAFDEEAFFNAHQNQQNQQGQSGQQQGD